MGDFAYRIDYALWFICLLLLTISITYRLNLSTRVALTVWVTGNLCMDMIEPFVMDMATLYKEAGASIWYITWSAIDILCLWCIYKIHYWYRIPVSQLSRYIMICFLSLCALQFMRYADRVVFDFNLLAAVYKYVIVSINISVVPFAIYWLVKDIQATKKGIV